MTASHARPARASTAARKGGLPRPVWLLGWVSFFTDTASEGIYPLLPTFLSRTLGASALSLGFIEGVAEAASSLLKLLSGRVSDRFGVRRPLVLGGYGLSNLVRPLIGVAQVWPHVLALRFVDRLGKGIRGAPRDAMLADLAPEGARGRVFGLNRAMDHAGAVAGPLLASLFLWFYPERYRLLFLLTVIPGALAVVCVLGVPRDPSAGPRKQRPSPSTGAHRSGVRLPARLRAVLGVILLFTLGNSTDAFLLLRLNDLGVAITWLPLVWALQHVVKSVSSVWGGQISDRLGRPRVIGAGWVLYAAVYAAFAVTASETTTVVVFLVYGVYYGLTEGAEKALVADLVPPSLRGTAFGWYNAVVGVGALLASVGFGFVWTRVSPAAAFFMGATLALAAAAALPLALAGTAKASSSGGGS